MRPPRLTRMLALESPRPMPDGMGGRRELWEVLGTLHADVRARTGREKAFAAGALSDTGYRITVRAAPAGSPQRPVPGQRLRDGERRFRIEAVTEADAAGRYLICFANEEVAP
ncbi:MAG: head-tail adaptor protein [Roseivivax sp.]|nr:head-tail adaptor protein [Roseivivax sp.]